MKKIRNIVTVGISPAWDMILEVENVDWASHATVLNTTETPAGKALNVSKALAWLGETSIAAGLWGSVDYDLMKKRIRETTNNIKIRFTIVQDRTRQNITIIDRAKNREMHFRNQSTLATKKSLEQLIEDMAILARAGSLCVFAGAMDADLKNEITYLVSDCFYRDAKVVLDSSGEVFKHAIETGEVWMISPNVAELSEVVGKDLPNSNESLIKAAKGLLDRVRVVLISQGPKGAIVVTKDEVYSCETVNKRKAVNTVGCGDWLLAGFIEEYKESEDIKKALGQAVKVATAKAWGLIEENSWAEIRSKIKIDH